jgi:ribosomal protein S18 acetylase RimI-like enzyme
MSQPVIREFQYPQDYPAARALWESAGAGIGLGRSDTPEEIQKKLLRDPDLFLIAEADGRLLGTVIGGYDGRRGMVYHLAVEATCREQGIGSALMDELERRMRAKGCVKYYLLVKRGNKDVIAFYEKRGWESMDLTIMGKAL